MNIGEAIRKFPSRPSDAHKGDLGHVFVLAGSVGYTGAAYLTSQAAVLSGSGLVTLAVGKSLYGIMAEKLVEVMVRPYFETRDCSLSMMAEKELVDFSARCNCIAMGPGMSQNKDTGNLIRSILPKLDKPVVLDADGINAFAGLADLLKNAKGGLVLTPHPGEMSRLIGVDTDEIGRNRKDIAISFAREYNTVLVLKGHNTVVAGPGGDFYINETGNSGMASGGMGDILTGIIAGFISQKCDLVTASVLGVYFHGLAGDMALKEKGTLGLIATDLLNKLPEVLKRLA
jgi:NAD(P)H-hydrate epimerase